MDDDVIGQKEKFVLAQTILESLFSLYAHPSYLEVGVFKGETFLPLRARRKVAVDPNFKFDVDSVRVNQRDAEFHSVASDVYFGQLIDPEECFDIIFLDGLHTFEQTLRDFANATHFIKPDGVIMVDDVFPTSWAASLPSMELAYRAKAELGQTSDGGNWMGDVYRLPFFLDAFYQQYTYRTVLEGHGRLLVWRQRRAAVAQRKVEEIGRLPYESVILEKDAFHHKPFAVIREEIAAAVAQTRAGRPACV